MDEGGAPAAGAEPGILEARDAGVLFKQAVDDGLEGTRALAVDEPDLGDAAAQALADVYGHQVLDVLRAERVEVEDAVDRELDGIVVSHERTLSAGARKGGLRHFRHAGILAQNGPERHPRAFDKRP